MQENFRLMKELPSFLLLIHDDRQFSPNTVIACFVRSVTQKQEKYQGNKANTLTLLDVLLRYLSDKASLHKIHISSVTFTSIAEE